MNILEIKNLNISFYQYDRALKRRRIDIIKDLNLEVKKGEIFVIFGASGSGKSLLAEAIFSLLPYNSKLSGEIFYKNKLLDEKTLCNIRGKDIFYIPQTIGSLNPILKTAYQAKLTLDKSQYKKVDKIYKDFGLGEDVFDMYPFELSGGMARRVLVSDALISNADFIVADEPTPGMDKASTDEIISKFIQLKEKGVTSVIISHDMKMGLACADRIGIFYNGQIIEIVGAKDFDKGNLKNPYSQMLINALPENGLKIIDKDMVNNL